MASKNKAVVAWSLGFTGWALKRGIGEYEGREANWQAHHVNKNLWGVLGFRVRQG